jgi:phosphatidate cytidylyltransferase
VSHRDSGEGDTTASGDETPPDEDVFSAEDEFRRWAEETEAGQPEEAGGQGWAARIFGRRKPTDEQPSDPTDVIDEATPVAAPEPTETEHEPSPADLEDAAPNQLGVFRAINPAEGRPAELGDPDTADRPEARAPGATGTGDSTDEPDARFEFGPVAETTEPRGATPPAEQSQPGVGATTPESPEPIPAGAAGSPGFVELWSSQHESESPDQAADDEDDIVDFAEFTSEDYLAATTREYAGLAEAVARAEEEGTQQIAVSAEIRGLESGIVGLDDVVDAEGGNSTEDMIEPPSGSDLSIRVLTAVGLVVLFAASLLSPYGIGALVFVVLGIAAVELFAALMRAGYRPLPIFGYLGIAGLFIGTWLAGPIAVPVALLVTTVAVFLFFATVPGRRAVVDNASLTVAVTAWIGGLGAFAFDLLGSDEYQWLVLALVMTVAAMDIGSYFIGRRLGKRPLAPAVSPKKTVEGYIAGIIMAMVVGAAFGWAPPFDLTDGLIIGAIVAVVGPVGDLAVSVVKRALGVKDMGYLLPGHGGVLDRVDAMIIAIPALWIAYSWMGLIN